MSRIVVALGGNALGSNPTEQLELTKTTAKTIVSLISKGNEVIVTHGNGPQVGLINLAFEEASKIANIPAMPFPECGAMSQGYIGYHLQNAIQNELNNLNIDNLIATIITQVVVDKGDPAFNNPSKPIGAFYSKEISEKLAREKGYIMKEDANRGYRRVVASPKPVGIVEIEIIKTLVDSKYTVITVGGGGIPVIKDNNKYIGVPAVIDKDLASSKLASLIDSDILIILTAVDNVSINFGKPNQTNLESLSVSDAIDYMEKGEFHKGSMLEKVQAAVDFANSKKGRVAIIGSLLKAEKLLDGTSGTRIAL